MIKIKLEKWQVENLRTYFGRNDKTMTSHWAFTVFDDALKKHKKALALSSAESHIKTDNQQVKNITKTQEMTKKDELYAEYVRGRKNGQSKGIGIGIVIAIFAGAILLLIFNA